MKEVNCSGAIYVVPEFINFKCPDAPIPISLPPENAWSIIHRRIALADDWNEQQQRQYYENAWLDKIPNCGQCRTHWKQLTTDRPIDWTTQQSAFYSLWELHNIVSDKYSKNEQIQDVCQAWKLWRGPRVAFVAGNYANHGGSESFAMMLLTRLRHHVNIVGFGAVIGGGNPTWLKVPFYLGSDAIQYLCNRADIVVTWGTRQLMDLLPEKKPKVIAIHHGDVKSGWFLEAIENCDIDEFVCVNREVAEHIRHQRNCPVHYIPNAVDPSRLVTTNSLQATRESIPFGKKVCLFGHRMAVEKRPELAIEIARFLPDDWILVMAGDGTNRPESVLSNVRMVGHVDTLANWLAVADCFLSLSTFEGFGLSMAEAAIVGVPIIATPVGIAPDVAATLLPMDASPEQWAQAIVESIGKQNKPADFSVDKHVAQWVEVLR